VASYFALPALTLSRRLEPQPLDDVIALTDNSSCAAGQLLHAGAELSFPHIEERLVPSAMAVIRKGVRDESMRPPRERYKPSSCTLVKPLQT